MSPDLQNVNFSELYVEKSRPKILYSCMYFYLYEETANQLTFYNIISSFPYSISPPTMLLVMDRDPDQPKI